MDRRYLHRVILLKSWPQFAACLVLGSSALVTTILLESKGFVEFEIMASSFIAHITLIAALSGTIGAIMVGFIISRLQSIESERRSWYFELKREAEKLTEALHNLPDKYLQLCEPTDKCIQYIENLNIRTDLFICRLDWDIIQKPSQIAFKDEGIDTTDKDVYALIQSTVRIEEYLQELSVNWLASNIAGKLMVNCSSKLFYILAFSLLGLAFFGVTGETYIYNKYVFLSLITLITLYLVLVIFEITIHTKDYYREVTSFNKGKMDNLEVLT